MPGGDLVLPAHDCAAEPLDLGWAGVVLEIDRLRGYEKMPPSAPKRKKRMTMRDGTGEMVKLTPQEYAIYDRWHLKAKDHLAQIIKGPAYARMPDAMKAKVLRKTYDKYRYAANKEIALAVRKRTTVGE